MREHKDYVSEDGKKELERQIEGLRNIMKENNPEAIKNASDELHKTSLKMFEEAYTRKANENKAKEDQSSSSSGGGSSGPTDAGQTIDAEVDDKDKDKDKKQ